MIFLFLLYVYIYSGYCSRISQYLQHSPKVKGFCNTPRELQNYSLANISTCIFMLNMLPYQMQEE